MLPAWRGQGVASALVRRVEQQARAAGIGRLYLYTPDQRTLYRRLGWEDRESLGYRGEAVTVMCRLLDNDAPPTCTQ
ncbi:GNAT family N-acetyltransferase [Halomonas sp. WWR20]